MPVYVAGWPRTSTKIRSWSASDSSCSPFARPREFGSTYSSGFSYRKNECQWTRPRVGSCEDARDSAKEDVCPFHALKDSSLHTSTRMVPSRERQSGNPGLRSAVTYLLSQQRFARNHEIHICLSQSPQTQGIGYLCNEIRLTVSTTYQGSRTRVRGVLDLPFENRAARDSNVHQVSLFDTHLV